jgi:hypothetical protein
MPALVAGIHVLRKFIEQIPPIGILPVNQPHLPRARPVFNRLLALNGGTNIVIQLKINEVLQAILIREATPQTAAMFAATADEIAGNADVKRAIATIGHYVNKAASHPHTVSKTWMPATSAGMTIERQCISSSWPDLFRPSTSLIFAKRQGVDARHKAGHDGGESEHRSLRNSR